ncbi:MAG: hypothetical protein OEW89_10785 [Gammaproteobacteria bacterium]|nr:hypothetical protein [Gammaproteobacteria bacterium]MDH5592951.1 hypothetical protein [Gammaproteobacteria bacterium]MDH5613951.1 hypothetical protein [Gammaproteobacteria bacterium]
MNFNYLYTITHSVSRAVLGGMASVCLFIALTGNANAAEVVRANVEQNGDTYSTHYEIRLNAPAEDVRRVLTDVDQLVALMPDVQEYMVKRRVSSNKADVQLVMRTCVLSICKQFTQKERFYIGKNGQLKGRFIPVGSDFATGQSSYKVIADKNGTRIQFNASMNPKFWVPFGKVILSYTLKNFAERLAVAIDQHVTMQAAGNSGKNKKPV